MTAWTDVIHLIERAQTGDREAYGELVERFGTRPVPAKFALADIGGRTVCFDFEEG